MCQRKRGAPSSGRRRLGVPWREDRHFALVILTLEAGALPDGPGTIPGLAAELLAQREIRKLVRAYDTALTLPNDRRPADVERAYDALALMFWEPQMPLQTARYPSLSGATTSSQ